MTRPRTQPTKKALSKKALPQHLIDVILHALIPLSF